MICEHLRQLRIRDLGPWPADTLAQAWPNTRIELTTTVAGFGGQRSWFLCPGCHRRCGVLYSHVRHIWACRVCCRAHYASEVEGPLDRLYRKARKLRRSLGQDDPNMTLPFPAKPLGMHWSTYLALREQGVAVEKVIIDALDRKFPDPARCRVLDYLPE